MATGANVLSLLRPNGGWVIYGNDFDSIIYDEGVTPVAKNDFDNGFALADAKMENESKELQLKKEALLERLGITEDEAKLLLA